VVLSDSTREVGSLVGSLHGLSVLPGAGLNPLKVRKSVAEAGFDNAHLPIWIMKMAVRRTDGDFPMEALSESGNAVAMDGSAATGGHPSGARPIGLLLMALGGCLPMIDVLSIPRMQAMGPGSLDVEVRGEREADAVPWPFREISVVFTVGGEADRQRVHPAAAFSMERSVATTLEPTSSITW
jgi:putative redox protein